jgi:hypothetical protein
MFRALLLAAAVAALPGPTPALAQSSDQVTISASCDYGGSYGVRGGPVQGWIQRYGGVYTIDLYVPPTATRAAVGTLRDNDYALGWIHLDLDSPSLDLADPAVRLDIVSIQGRAVVAGDEGSATWRVRLTIGEEADWYGPGGVGEPVFTHTGYTPDQPFASEPYIGFFDREREPAGLNVYRRLIAEGRLTAEFHVPRRGFRSGYLFSTSEFSLAPLPGFLRQAQAHFDACEAQAAS